MFNNCLPSTLIWAGTPWYWGFVVLEHSTLLYVPAKCDLPFCATWPLPEAEAWKRVVSMAAVLLVYYPLWSTCLGPLRLAPAKAGTGPSSLQTCREQMLYFSKEAFMAWNSTMESSNTPIVKTVGSPNYSRNGAWVHNSRSPIPSSNCNHI